MRLIARGGATAAALLVLAAGCGGDGDNTADAPAPQAVAAERVTLPLKEERSSGQSGTATLTPVDENSMSVVIKLTPTKKYSYEPAHIHKGTCAEYRKLKTFDAQLATVVDELQDVTNGRSESTLYTASLADRTTGRYSINVHVPVGANEVVACGDIPRR